MTVLLAIEVKGTLSSALEAKFSAEAILKSQLVQDRALAITTALAVDRGQTSGVANGKPLSSTAAEKLTEVRRNGQKAMAELITAAEQLQASKLNQLISAAEDLRSQIYGTATTNTGLPPDMAPRWFAAQSKLIEAVDELARHHAYQRYCRPHQSACTQRNDRSGPGRRSRSWVCRRGAGSEAACRPDGPRNFGDIFASHDDPIGDEGFGRRHRHDCHPGAQYRTNVNGNCRRRRRAGSGDIRSGKSRGAGLRVDA